MSPVTDGARNYDPATLFFHWATAALVVVQWLGAQTIDLFPSGPLRVDARSVHITGGVVLAILLAARLLWRATGGRRLPPADSGAFHVIAKATHWGLYGLLAAMVLAGLFLTWARGDSLFNQFTLPRFDATKPALADQAQQIHALIGWMILGLAGLHAGAALAHHYLWRDDVLRRMLPRR